MEITEKKLKNILKEQREEFQRYMGVLTEGFNDKIQLVAESVCGIQEQLVIIRDMVVKNTEDIEMIKMDMEIMKSDINTTKVDMEIMKSDINIIKNDLKQKVALEDFNALEKRMILLEAKMRKTKFA